MIRKIFASVVPPSSGQRFPALDGLRGLAILGVVLLHAEVLFERHMGILGAIFWKLGSMSLCMFFVLSAFLLYYPMVAGKSRGVGIYFRRRFFRIMPAYLMVIPFGILIAFIIRGRLITFEVLLARLLFIFSWSRKWGFIELDGTWSLVPEVQFYLLLPLLALLLAGRAWLLIPLGALAVFFQSTVRGSDHSGLWHNLPVLFLPFLLGMMAAFVAARYRGNHIRLGFLAPLGLLLIYLYPLSPLLGLKELYPGGQGVQVALLNPRGLWPSLACAMAIVGLASSSGTWTRLLSSDWIRAIGICSYGTFLFNWPIFWFLLIASRGNWHIVQLGIPLSLAIGFLSYLFVEAPMMRFGARGFAERNSSGGQKQ